MAIELISKIKPKNGGNFPMVDAHDVELPNGLRLDEAVENFPLQFVAVACETSFDDIKAAYKSGKPCVAVYDDANWTSVVYPLISYSDTMIVFGGFGGGGEGVFRIFKLTSDGVWYRDEYDISSTSKVVTYDLVAMGFPNVICNGDPVYAETDTTEIMEVLATSIVTLNLNIAYSGLVFSNIKATFTPNSMYSIAGMPGLEFVVCLVVTEGKVTLSAKYAGFVPGSTTENNGQILQVVEGIPQWVSLENSAVKTYIDEYIAEALGGEY